MMPKAHKSLPKGKLCFESEKTLNAANRTALHVAARFNEFECAKILVNSQADINAKDKDNKTPLQLAAGFNKDASHCASINVLVCLIVMVMGPQVTASLSHTFFIELS